MANVAFDLTFVATVLATAYIQYQYYVGDMVTAVENKEEIVAGSSDRIQPGQAGNDHCQYM